MKGQIQAAADVDRAQVEYGANTVGIPDERTVYDNTAAVMDQAVADMNATTDIMDSGRSGVIRDSDEMQEVVSDKQRIYSAGSTPSAHETVDKVKNKLTNTFKNVFD